MEEPQALSEQQRLREFTLLIAQIAVQFDMTDGELAAAAGGACAVHRLLRRVTALEEGRTVDDVSAESLVMLFDSRMRLPVVVEGDGEDAAGAAFAATAPGVALQ